MKKFLLFSSFSAFAAFASAQCTTTNATSCQCLNSTSTNCDLLPDITVSWYAFQTYMGGPNEYPQTNAGTSVNGQGPDDGRLRLTGSTPNTGKGPMEVRAVDSAGNRWFLCGTDTFSIYDPNGTAQFTCPNGEPNPKQMLKQRIYHKNGNTMTYYERFAGTMTYHPTHMHYHVDDWEIMTLRINNGDPNPLNWPIVGTGNKVGFCIEDYQSCSTANGHCRDSANNILLNNNIINYGLGGANYGCGLIFQGITTGWTDIYWETLDGQWINIDPNICNGQYYVVIQVDPHNYFLEENEGNNYFAEPITLTQQLAPGNPVINITAVDNQFTTLCQGDSVTLKATAGTSIVWSTGATTQNIRVSSAPATYSVTVTDYCGTGTASYTINQAAPVSPLTSFAGDTVCNSGVMTLTASGSGTPYWYDSQMNQVGTGNSYTTPNLTTSATYYVANTATHQDTAFATPHTNDNGAGTWVQSAQYDVFRSLTNMTIRSVRVYAQNAGNRTIQLQDSIGNVVQTLTVNIPNGMSRVTLNFNCNAGVKYRLYCAATTGSLNLYRNNSANVSYPYGVPGVVTITGSSGGASYYYFFYDWEVASSNVICESAMQPVVAYVDNCSSVGENFEFKNSINVFPNPSNGNFTLSFKAENAGNISIKIVDMMGKEVYADNVGNFSGKYSKTISASTLSKGVYFVQISYDGKPYYTKIVIQ